MSDSVIDLIQSLGIGAIGIAQIIHIRAHRTIVRAGLRDDEREQR